MIKNSIVTEAMEYIFLNIWRNVTVDDIANHCHVSVSYLEKLFRAQTQQSVYAFMKRIKMEQSAMKLKMEADRSITEIGEDYGYSSSNYSSAFSLYHDIAPSAFRNEMSKRQDTEQKIFEEIDRKIQIEMRPDYTVMYERTIGSYSDMKAVWCDFVDRYKDDIDENTIFFERTFDDPTITQKNRCIYDICMSTATPEKYANSCILQGGKFAIYRYQGYIVDIYPVNQQLVGIWFPKSHNELDNRYNYDRYYAVADDGYMDFEICIPIRG